MNQDTLFRMNFIIQENNATTTKTYLIKIIECVLFNSTKPLTLQEIKTTIQDSYHLEFTEYELTKALSHKKAHIKFIDNKFQLNPEYSDKMSHYDSVEDKLNSLTNKFIKEFNLSVNHGKTYNLITKFLYHCFNSNKNVLLSLVNGEKIEEDANFKVSNDEISIINKFLSWTNDDKNKLIYDIISYCYVYCSLTTKKDSLLSKSLFKNKHFILDANIIFRLAGINKDERQKTILSFVNKCNEVGIKLSYTNHTLNELIRVIDSKVKWLRSVTHSKEPLDIEALESYGNDFYNIYVEWCKEPQNAYDDFFAFNQYLFSRVKEVISPLNYITCPNYKDSNPEKFNSYAKSLRDYKLSHSSRQQTDYSIETDVYNSLYVIENRENNQDSIFSTNDYFISADQNLIGWSKECISGIPLIVLPSVWLTIILRFTGRSDNDYQAFCSFMRLRTHDSNNEFDIFAIIRQLGFHTDSKTLKEQITMEILLHQDEYISSDDNNKMNNDDTYEKTVVKAFDTITKKNNSTLESEFNKKFADKEKQLEREKQEIYKLSLQQERQKNIKSLVHRDFIKKTKFPKILSRAKNIIYSIIVFIFITCIVLWAFDIEPIYSLIEAIIPNKFATTGDKIEFLGSTWAILIIIYGSINKLLKYLTSQSYYKKLNDRLFKKYTDIFKE